MTGPVQPPSTPAMPPNLVRPTTTSRRRRRTRRRSNRPLIIVAVVVVLVVIAGAAFVLLKASGIKTGSGTATLTWKVSKKGAGPSPKSYRGTVDGLALSGKSSGVAPAATGTAPAGAGGALPLSHWTGTLGGKKFDLNVTETIGSGAATATSNKYLGNFSITFHITGTYGTDAVKATASADPRHTGRLQFNGTIGTFHVKGTASEPKESATKGKIRASFVVSG